MDVLYSKQNIDVVTFSFSLKMRYREAEKVERSVCEQNASPNHFLYPYQLASTISTAFIKIMKFALYLFTLKRLDCWKIKKTHVHRTTTKDKKIISFCLRPVLVCI